MMSSMIGAQSGNESIPSSPPMTGRPEFDESCPITDAIVLPIAGEFFNIPRSMRILLTGVAGFIGARTASLLLARGHEVVGVDNMNDYYDVRLKQHRLQELVRVSGSEKPVDGLSAFKSGGLSYHPIDVESYSALEPLFAEVGLVVEKRIPLTASGRPRTFGQLAANLMASSAIYVLQRGAPTS